MGLKVLMIGAYPLEPGMVHGGIESATSMLVPALAARDDIDNVAGAVFPSRRGVDRLPARRPEGRGPLRAWPGPGLVRFRRFDRHG